MRSTPPSAALLAAALLAAGFAPPARAGDRPTTRDAELRAIAGAVSATSLHDLDAALVGFGTRSTLSETKSPTRGIGAARRWVKAQFEHIGRGCGGCLRVVTPSKTFVGKRTPKDGVEVVDVVAIQRGTTDPERVIVITAHLDSRRTDVMDAVGDAPGADDDGSGVSALIEAARVLSRYKFPATLVYSADSGEEQGLYGGQIIAQYALDHGWRVEANLNNDIVGSPRGGDGQYAPHEVRVFSEGTRATETAADATYRRFHGGEADSPSRNVARFMESLADQYLGDFKVRRVDRTDRYGRAGDQVPFLERGFPAVRVTESREDYTHQHQDVRVEHGVSYGDTLDHVDFAYLANVTRVDALTLAALASAPMPPPGVDARGALAYDATVSWKPSPGATGYRVWWRETTAPRWQHAQGAGAATSLVLRGIDLDDVFVGVSAIGPGGWESPVEFPGAAGRFARE